MRSQLWIYVWRLNFARIRQSYGSSRDRRPDLKQIQTGLAVAADGAIPVFHRAYDGGPGEVAQFTAAMTTLKNIAGPRTFSLVGDSRLVSRANAAAMAAGQVAFIAPLAAARVPAGLFAALPPGPGTVVDYVAERDAGKPASARGTYRVLEDDGMDIRGTRKSETRRYPSPAPRPPQHRHQPTPLAHP